jgi:hypothetical protein
VPHNLEQQWIGFKNLLCFCPNEKCILGQELLNTVSFEDIAAEHFVKHGRSKFGVAWAHLYGYVSVGGSQSPFTELEEFVAVSDCLKLTKYTKHDTDLLNDILVISWSIWGESQLFICKTNLKPLGEFVKNKLQEGVLG